MALPHPMLQADAVEFGALGSLEQAQALHDEI